MTVGRGDIVLIRTGQMAQCRDAGSWGAYAGGPAPGLALDAATWIFDREHRGRGDATRGAWRSCPTRPPDVFQPLHIILIVHMGLLVGEIFDLEALADDCAADGRYEFLFSAPPLPDHRRRRLAGEPDGHQVARRAARPDVRRPAARLTPPASDRACEPGSAIRR